MVANPGVPNALQSKIKQGMLEFVTTGLSIKEIMILDKT